MNKNNNKYLLLLSAGALLSITAGCTADFEEVNTNQLQPKEQYLERDGLKPSAYIPTLQFNCYIPTATEKTDAANNYQVSFNLTADSWVGYMAPRDAKWSGRNLTQFYFDVGWTNGTFSNVTRNILSPWVQTKKVAYDIPDPNKGIWGMAQICKIMGLHRAADMYGAIPYSQIESGSFTVPYDSQESVYKSFFKELESAIDDLYNLSKEGKEIYGLDYVYNGQPLKWAKLGNSLMLRLAMRVRYVAPELSKEWASKALHHPAGMIQTVDDMAMIAQSHGVNAKNSLHIVANTYDDTRMGATIYTYMKGYNDPRLQLYFKGDDLDFAVPPAIPASEDKYNKAAKPVVKEFDPTIWFRPSETYFLLAEAALFGYSTEETAKSYYEKGIALSFEERGATGVDEYIKGTSLPAAFKDKAGLGYDAPRASSITVAWGRNGDQEVQLEKIITQKYIALFPDGQEAWSEWRRTGYPRLIAPNTNISNYGVIRGDGHTNGVRCWPYPQDELNNNTKNVNDAINAYRGGFNGANVKVWWDAKPAM